MAMSSTGTMQAKLGLDLTQFQSGAKQASASAQKMASNINASWGSVSRSVEVRAAKSFDQLRASIDPAFAATQRYGDLQRQVAGYVDSGVVSQRAANLVLEQAASKYLGVATASERAARALREGERAQEEQARATQLATQNYQSLRASVDPLYAASKRYESALETLTAAQRAGKISDVERARTLQLLDAQLAGVGNQMTRAGGISGRMSGAFSNASFQVQDFFVQIAGGTDAMRAFSMQAPQLLGALGFTGKLAMIGAGMGTLVAMGAVVLPMFMKMGSGAKEAGKAVDDLTQSVSDYTAMNKRARMSLIDLTDDFGKNADQARELYKAMAALKRLDAIESMGKAVTEVTGSLGGIESRLKEIDALQKGIERNSGIGGWAEGSRVSVEQVKTLVAELGTEYGLTEAQARQAYEMMQGISKLGFDDQVKAAQNLGQYLFDASNGGSELTDNAREAVTALMEAGIEGLNILNAVDLATGQTNTWASAMSGVRAELQGIFAAMAQLGGGLIARTANFVEQDALKAGKTVAEARLEVEKFKTASEWNGKISAAQQQGGLFGWVKTKALEASKQFELTSMDIQVNTDKMRESAAEAERAAQSSSGSMGASTKAAKASQKLAKDLDAEAKRWREILDPTARYRNELTDLAKVQSRLSGDELADAVKHLNVELADSLPLVGGLTDELVNGLFSGFKGTLSDIGSMFKDWLVQMIATAAKNKIIVSMGLGVSPVAALAGGAGQAVGGVAGAAAGGAAGAGAGFLGGVGTIGSSFISGASGLLTSLTGAGGGLGAAGTYLSATLGGATSGLSGLAAAAGAVALPIAAVTFALTGLIGKTKVIDGGIRVLTEGMDSYVQSYQRVEKSRFWGLSKSARNHYTNADADVADPITAAVGDVQSSIVAAAKTLGIGASAFDDFSYRLQISTKGLSKDEALEKLEEELSGLGNEFAGMVDGIDAFRDAGEGAMEAVSRLAGALGTVNRAMDTLEATFHAVGLSGAAMASDLTAQFGGDDAFQQAVASYYGAFYSEAERTATATRQASEALADLGLIMPRTRAEYRALIDSMDLGSQAGRDMWTALVQMSGTFDEILPKVGAMTAQIEALSGAVSTNLDAAIASYTSAQQASAQAAKNWYDAADNIADFIASMRGTPSAMTAPDQALAFSQARYQTMLASAVGGDLDAVKGLTGMAEAYLDRVADTAGTAVDLARAQARVVSDLGTVKGASQIEGARQDVLADLYGQQVDLMEEVRDYLAAGNALTEGQIADLQMRLGGLDEAIKAAELINYQYLKERLQVTVDVLADADVPDYLRTLLGQAANGVEGYIDFIVRSDLTPDLKWLAMTGASEHLKTVAYLADNKLGALTDLALADEATVKKITRFLADNNLGALSDLALADQALVDKWVVFAARNNLGQDLTELALANVSLLQKQVKFWASNGLSGEEMRLALADSSTLSRGINIWLKSGMTAELRAALVATSRAIGVRVDGRVVSDRMPLLRELMLDVTSGAMIRTVIGQVDLSGLSTAQRALLDGISGAQSGTIQLGGSYVFDPSTSFQTWYERATQTNLGAPMATLRGSLDDLRGAVVSSAQLAAEVSAQNARMVQLQERKINAEGRVSELSGIIRNVQMDHMPANPFVTAGMGGTHTDEYTRLDNDRFWSWEKQLRKSGYDTSELTRDNYLKWIEEIGRYQNSTVWLDRQLGSLDARQDNLGAINDLISDLRGDMFGAVPKFATGGRHAGGLRIVGENGPELEETGPSRIYNAHQTRRMLSGGGEGGSSGALLAEVKALRAEMAGLREESRQLGMQTADHTRKTARKLEQFDRDGLPAERA